MSKEALREIFRSTDPLHFHYPLGRETSYTILEAEDSDYSYLYLSTPEGTRAQLVAPFDGTVFYSPVFDRLSLCLSASTNLRFRSMFDGEETCPVNMCWDLVERESIVTSIREIAVARNVESHIAEQEIEVFLAGEVGINIRSGDVIGNASAADFSMSYYEEDGTQINALYVLWKLKQHTTMNKFSFEGDGESDTESEPHPLSSAIAFITGNFELSISPDGNDVVSDGGAFGLYRKIRTEEIL